MSLIAVDRGAVDVAIAHGNRASDRDREFVVAEWRRVMEGQVVSCCA